jgi:prophage antirepressor-like protein
MDKIIDEYEIKKSKRGLYNLNDIVNNIIKSKNPISYIDKVTEKKKMRNSNNWYITEDRFITLLKRGRNSGCKKAYLLLSKKDTSTLNLNNKVDIKNNYCLYNGSEINVYNIDGNLWFRGLHIAKLLEYKYPKNAIKNNIEIEDKINYNNLITDNKLELNPKNKLNSIFINESGLYSLCINSKKKKAKVFKRWITKEVLPSIRKTGKYDITNSKLIYDLNNYVNKSCVYIINIKDNLYKFGISDNMAQRGTNHLNNFNKSEIIKIFNINNYTNCRLIEKKIISLVKQLKINRYYNINDDTILKKNEKNAIKECFITNEKYTIEHIINYINEYVNKFKDNINNIELQIEKEKTKQIEIQEKSKQILEQEKTKQIIEQEKTKQLNIQLELKKLEIRQLELKKKKKKEK